jgi:hypothetical protein
MLHNAVENIRPKPMKEKDLLLDNIIICLDRVGKFVAELHVKLCLTRMF